MKNWRRNILYLKNRFTLVSIYAIIYIRGIMGNLSVRNNQVGRAVYLEWRVKRFELHI
uniref:Uncharacterized protein n=1 Tax=Myoviridae sp. ctMnh10 TaxID=2827682 RepID=A0A8S5TIC5_9CAUD|nr:MAG TPA: hypothetical protein [Myoviridae sp. ctMnh10]